MKKKFCILALFIIVPNIILAEPNNQTSGYVDPYLSTNYETAFNVEILAKFSDVLATESISEFLDIKLRDTYWGKTKKIFHK